jgi:DNA-binding MarR family transcriptional regulator
MSSILPQQRLLLELLTMSGDIAVADDMSDTILERTIEECEKQGWVKRSIFGAGFHKTTITPDGRAIIKARS